MRILDYFYYRAYIRYAKAGDDGDCGAIFSVMVCLIGLSFPILTFVGDFMRSENESSYKVVSKVVYFLCLAILIGSVAIRYLKFRTFNKLREEFSDSPLNSKIPTCFFWIFPMFLVIFGFVGIALVRRYIIAPYHLEGAGYRWLQEIINSCF